MKVRFEVNKSLVFSNIENFDLENLTLDGFLVRSFPERINNLMVTKCNGDAIFCWNLKDVEIKSENGCQVFQCSQILPAHGVFSLLDWLYPDAKTLLDLAHHYDGHLYWHDNSALMKLEKDQIESTTSGCFSFITGYN